MVKGQLVDIKCQGPFDISGWLELFHLNLTLDYPLFSRRKFLWEPESKIKFLKINKAWWSCYEKWMSFLLFKISQDPAVEFFSFNSWKISLIVKCALCYFGNCMRKEVRYPLRSPSVSLSNNVFSKDKQRGILNDYKI